MKNLLKKLHIMSNPSENLEGSTSSKTNKFRDVSVPDSGLQAQSNHNSEHKDKDKPFSGISGWLNSVTNKRSPSPTPPSSSNVTRRERSEQSDSVNGSAQDVVRRETESSNLRDPDTVDEEYQIQMALELSAREDPEAVQIEAVKQISLGSFPPDNTPAEVTAYRYWNYNSLSYDDKILDGFYDLYGILIESNSSKMPSLVDLQRTPVSDNITWEAVLVNKASDSKLLRLEQKALEIAVKSRSECLDFDGADLVQKLAVLVSDHMGGPVGDPENMLMAWKNLSYKLKETLGSMVLPLGSLTIGLARHRAVLFKVLADSVGIPCRLMKGQQYTGSDDVAMNFVRIHGAREYIVDLMADPGTLIPSDTTGSDLEYERSFFSTPLAADSSSSTGSSENKLDERSELVASTSSILQSKTEEGSKTSSATPGNSGKETVRELPRRSNYSFPHARSPSWTEGVSSPAAHKMKVKDVSQYMIDAAKENPQLAQKLHDVLLESGVVAPPDLFTEIYQEQVNMEKAEQNIPSEKEKRIRTSDDTLRNRGKPDNVWPRFLPPLPSHGALAKGGHSGQSDDQSGIKEVGARVSLQSDVAPKKQVKNVPVAAAAAAAAAAVVASSMVVAAARTTADTNSELPVAAAATATAAAMVATTVAVGNQQENVDAHSPSAATPFFNPLGCARSDGDADATTYEPRGSGSQLPDAARGNHEGERTSDRSAGNDSSRSDTSLEDVSDCEIPWEDITLGERIGLGSYGEVYRGDWHETEVAVKKFLDQELTGESLEEFKTEVWIMKRVRHPNVVLFMGAVTRPPNLSIVTEFLPRGSLYRLIHRPNNQLDVRRRLRMALDAARGMNYLHNCSPVIVHRDLKSPNLLVDKNWVVKVCDFGLSRMKHSTFLSSRSTAGTAEWMAPEVLRNEPSDEKCDVYSYGVILWELCTLQQPWGGMNPMQVVGAVGFQHRRLEIPDDIDPAIADIICKCWQTDPKLRPSFSEIMAALKPLQKPISNSQVPRPPSSASSGQ
ncbi:putative serine/threonine-protein kinase SIS8 [Heracleum sosnowskyi]|uniref:non-specific serine/threonine protein kinase n=1 Tax=Heracleum sosnowskyi TaxID=360622 RepID=A0AAD8HTQ4_9APIA|nr:putative serine/threonine-protein kinase SIS8 [Heracleum sosnowskyi]